MPMPNASRTARPVHNPLALLSQRTWGLSVRLSRQGSLESPSYHEADFRPLAELT